MNLETITTPSLPKYPFSSRAEVQQKLLHHLELATHRTYLASDALTTIRCTPLYLAMIVSAHFKLPHQASDDAIAASATIHDLTIKIAELLNIPPTELF